MTLIWLAETPAVTRAVACRIGAVIAKRKVVIGRAAFVAVSLDGEPDRGMGLEECGIGIDRGLILGAQVVAVVVKVDVFDRRGEELLFGHIRCFGLLAAEVEARPR